MIANSNDAQLFEWLADALTCYRRSKKTNKYVSIRFLRAFSLNYVSECIIGLMSCRINCLALKTR